MRRPTARSNSRAGTSPAPRSRERYASPGELRLTQAQSRWASRLGLVTPAARSRPAAASISPPIATGPSERTRLLPARQAQCLDVVLEVAVHDRGEIVEREPDAMLGD